MTTDLQSMKGLSMKKGLVCLISALLVTGCALCPSETKQSADEAVVLTLRPLEMIQNSGNKLTFLTGSTRIIR